LGIFFFKTGGGQNWAEKKGETPDFAASRVKMAFRVLPGLFYHFKDFKTRPGTPENPAGISYGKKGSVMIFVYLTFQVSGGVFFKNRVPVFF